MLPQRREAQVIYCYFLVTLLGLQAYRLSGHAQTSVPGGLSSGSWPCGQMLLLLSAVTSPPDAEERHEKTVLYGMLRRLREGVGEFPISTPAQMTPRWFPLKAQGGGRPAVLPTREMSVIGS